MNWLRRYFKAQDEINRLKWENAGLRERNADLAGQIDWHSKAITISPENMEALRVQRESFDQLNDQQNQIAKYLRLAYADEIASGKHNGRELAEIIIGYLAELKLRVRNDQN